MVELYLFIFLLFFTKCHLILDTQMIIYMIDMQ